MLTKIHLGNCFSRLSSYTPELEQVLTVAHPNYWHSQRYKAGLWDGRTHFLKIPSLVFPTGLLHIVLEHLEETNTAYHLIDERKRPLVDTESWPDSFEDLLHGIKLRPYQQEAIITGLDLEQGCFEMATGSGKTEVAAGIIRLLGKQTLFIVHTRDLLRQTHERLSIRLGKPIGIFGDGKRDIERDVCVATVQTIDSWMRSESSRAKIWLKTFEAIFLDESHHASANTWYKIILSATSAYYRFGLSGTILRRDDLSNMKMMAAIGGLIYQLSAHELIGQGYLSKIKVHLLENPGAKNLRKGSWDYIYKSGIVNCSSRNGMIADIAERESKNGRVLILVRQIEHGRIIQDLLRQRGKEIPFLSGSDSSEKRGETVTDFEEGNHRIIIASTIFDEGVDIPSINVLIIAAGGKSEIRVIQRIGRGLRRKADGSRLDVYDFLDRGKFLSRHSSERRKTYEKERFI